MDDRTGILVCLGASAAANCVPCFEHYLGRARALDLSDRDIQEAVDLAGKIKNGAHVATRTHLDKIMGREVQATKSTKTCCERPDPSCCE